MHGPISILLAFVLYEMLTSRLPFEGDFGRFDCHPAHQRRSTDAARDLNPDIPAGLEDITMHAMEPDLNSRYASADELLEDLEEFRKNPAMTFNYAVNEHSVDALPEEQATRTIPSVAIVKAESNLPKPRACSAGKAILSREGNTAGAAGNREKTTTLVAVFTVIVVPDYRRCYYVADHTRVVFPGRY